MSTYMVFTGELNNREIKKLNADLDALDVEYQPNNAQAKIYITLDNEDKHLEKPLLKLLSTFDFVKL